MELEIRMEVHMEIKKNSCSRTAPPYDSAGAVLGHAWHHPQQVVGRGKLTPKNKSVVERDRRKNRSVKHHARWLEIAIPTPKKKNGLARPAQSLLHVGGDRLVS